MNWNGLKVAATGVLAITMVGCSAGRLGEDDQKLTSQQIEAALVDATAYGYYVNWRGQSSGDLLCMYHDTDGTVRGRDTADGEVYEVNGTYTIADDQICYSIPGAVEGEGCRWVVAASSAGGNVTGASFYGTDGTLVSAAEIGGGNQLSACLGSLSLPE